MAMFFLLQPCFGVAMVPSASGQGPAAPTSHTVGPIYRTKCPSHPDMHSPCPLFCESRYPRPSLCVCVHTLCPMPRMALLPPLQGPAMSTLVWLVGMVLLAASATCAGLHVQANAAFIGNLPEQHACVKEKHFVDLSAQPPRQPRKEG